MFHTAPLRRRLFGTLAGVLAAAGFLSLTLIPSAADALALSRGFQTLPIDYPECLARAYQALQAEGYNAAPSTGASFVGGFKGQHGAYITCGLGPTRQAEANVFVATEGTQDANVPGNERVRLQQRMNMAVAPPVVQPPPPPVTPPVAQGGRWTEWLNRDGPGASADYEALAEFSSAQVPCKPTAIECRVASDKRDWRAAGQRYSCTLSGQHPGGVCVNAENPGGCLDYEVRFFCPAAGTTSAPYVIPPVVVPRPAPTAAAPQYLGCFRDSNPFDLNGFLQRSAANSPQQCIQTCAAKGFQFAGVQYGESCLCGNSYGRYGPSNACNMRCTGDGSQVCGGINANTLYSTGVRR